MICVNPRIRSENLLKYCFEYRDMKYTYRCDNGFAIVFDDTDKNRELKIVQTRGDATITSFDLDIIYTLFTANIVVQRYVKSKKSILWG